MSRDLGLVERLGASRDLGLVERLEASRDLVRASRERLGASRDLGPFRVVSVDARDGQLLKMPV